MAKPKSYDDVRKRPKQGTAGARGKLHPLNIDDYQGMTLQEIEDGVIRGLGHEELFALDKDGKIIRAYKGNSNSVAFDGALLLEDGATVTHNHPIGGEGYGGTFSIIDVKNMAMSNWAEHRAVSHGPNEYNYIIRRTANSDGNGLYNRIARDQADLNRQIMAAANNARGLEGLSAARRRQIYTGILDNYYSRVLPEYGFEYIARNRTYKYNR